MTGGSVLKLNVKSVENAESRKQWIEKGYKLPQYDIEKMRENTDRKSVV